MAARALSAAVRRAAPLGGASPWIRAAAAAGGRAERDARALAAAAVAAAVLAAGAEQRRRSSWSRCEDKPLSHPPAAKSEKLVLAAECGCTTSRMMLYSIDPEEPIVQGQLPPGRLVAEERYPNIAFKSLTEIVQLFLTQDCGLKGAQPVVAVLSLSGIVIQNQCRFTNLDWVVKGSDLEKDFQMARVEVVNDFVAQGYGTLTLGDSEVHKLHDVPPHPGGNIAVIGAGVGLGQCYLVSDPIAGHYKCFPSEGGHAEFGPRGAGSEELQLDLLRYLKVKFSGWNRISMERVVSGTGICNIYDFLAYRDPAKVDPNVQKEHLKSPLDAGIIARNAYPGSICEMALKVFASCYGAAAGTLALFVQPFGGLYLTGGVTRRLGDWLLDEGSLLGAYFDKGRLSPLLDKVPLMVVKADNLAERGAHLRTVQLLHQEIDNQGRRLFDALDHRRRGKLHMIDLERACAKVNDKLAGRLLMVLEADDEGKVDWPRFRKGYARLPYQLIKELAVAFPSTDADASLRKDELVPPTERGSDEESQAKLAEILRKYHSRSRRKYIDPFEDKNSAVFKTIVWKLVANADPSDPAAWLERDFWISKEGSVCFHSVTENRAMLYCSRADLYDATIEPVEVPPGSAKPWVFKLQPRLRDGSELQATEFAVPTKECMLYWLQQLRRLQVEERASSGGNA